MNRLFKYKRGEIKVIWNEQPMVKDYEDKWIEKRIVKKTKQLLTSFSVGVEMMLPTGGRICYGLLSAKVEPHNEQDIVKLSMAFTSHNTVRYEESFLWNDEHVYKGLPEEYIGYVSNSICEKIYEKNIYPQCSILFEYAANCEVGSSPRLFEIIAEIIINLICTSSLDEICSINIEDFTKKYVKSMTLQY